MHFIAWGTSLKVDEKIEKNSYLYTSKTSLKKITLSIPIWIWEYSKITFYNIERFSNILEYSQI